MLCLFNWDSKFRVSNHMFEWSVISSLLCFNPLELCWGQWSFESIVYMMPRQPVRHPWSLDELQCNCAEALSHSVDISTCQAYSPALNSWVSLVKSHHFPIEPTINTLSFFIVYMSHHISPHSVKSYLSGLVQQLKPDFPSICLIRSSRFISKVMRGCLKMKATKIKRKKPLSAYDVSFIANHFHSSTNHDDLLFTALLVTSFHVLLRLGELTFPDNVSICDWCKVTRQASLQV